VLSAQENLNRPGRRDCL